MVTLQKDIWFLFLFNGLQGLQNHLFMFHIFMKVNGFFPIIADLAHYLLKNCTQSMKHIRNSYREKENPIHIWHTAEFHSQSYNQKAMKDGCSPAAQKADMLVRNPESTAG